MKKLYYKLDVNHNAIQVHDVVEWGRVWNSDRSVAKTTIEGIDISTVFLGLNHAFNDDDDPLLFETMVFGGNNDGYCERYSTWSEAEQGHHKICEMVLNNL